MKPDPKLLAVRKRMMQDYARIAREMSQLIADTDYWNRANPDERPIDREGAMVIRDLALQAYGHVQRWEVIPDDVMRRLTNALKEPVR